MVTSSSDVTKVGPLVVAPNFLVEPELGGVENQRTQKKDKRRGRGFESRHSVKLQLQAITLLIEN